jgi:hypothetical protein
MDMAALIAGLPADRRAEFERVAAFLREHVPPGYEMALTPNSIVYQVPVGMYSRRGRALWYVALSSEKSYMSLHVMPIYANPTLLEQLTDAYSAAGKKLNMGKACIRFRKSEELELDALAAIIAGILPARWVEIAESAWSR